MVVMEKTDSVAVAANSDESLKRLGDFELPILPFGNVNGLSGSLLTKTATKNIPASCLFAEVLNQYPDPEGSCKFSECFK